MTIHIIQRTLTKAFSPSWLGSYGLSRLKRLYDALNVAERPPELPSCSTARLFLTSTYIFNYLISHVVKIERLGASDKLNSLLNG